MSIFYEAVDDACDEKSKILGRDLNWNEVQRIEDTLFLEWLKARRFDELIDHALDEYELQDGEAFCGSLGEALAKAGENCLFERLFNGLANAREAAFWRAWPKAQEGHIGGMKESSRRLAGALEALAGLWHCYWVVNDEAGMESTKVNMLRLQAREKPKLGKGSRGK